MAGAKSTNKDMISPWALRGLNNGLFSARARALARTTSPNRAIVYLLWRYLTQMTSETSNPISSFHCLKHPRHGKGKEHLLTLTNTAVIAKPERGEFKNAVRL